MKYLCTITLAAAIISMLSACGGGTAADTASNAAQRPPAANVSNNQPPAGSAAATATAPADAVAEKRSVERRLNGSTGNPESNVQVIKINPDQTAKNPGTTLGDGSEVSTVLDARGAVETRTFKNHPQLAKLERTTNGNQVTVKVYLTNGRSVAVAGEKIRNFTNDSAEQILRAAGIEPKPAPAGEAPKEKTYTFTFPAKPAN
jgi:hypothetical protein